MSHKAHKPSKPGWVQVIAGLTVALALTAGTGHEMAPGPRPPTVCLTLRVLCGPSQPDEEGGSPGTGRFRVLLLAPSVSRLSCSRCT